MSRDNQNYSGSDRQKCLTRELVAQGHNINLYGLPRDNSGGCYPCNDPYCCSMLGKQCGCKALDCVDYM